MFESGTPVHDLSNGLAAPSVRMKHSLKECEKCFDRGECVNYPLIKLSGDEMLAAIDRFTKEIKEI